MADLRIILAILILKEVAIFTLRNTYSQRVLLEYKGSPPGTQYECCALLLSGKRGGFVSSFTNSTNKQ